MVRLWPRTSRFSQRGRACVPAADAVGDAGGHAAHGTASAHHRGKASRSPAHRTRCHGSRSTGRCRWFRHTALPASASAWAGGRRGRAGRLRPANGLAVHGDLRPVVPQMQTTPAWPRQTRARALCDQQMAGGFHASFAQHRRAAAAAQVHSSRAAGRLSLSCRGWLFMSEDCVRGGIPQAALTAQAEQLSRRQNSRPADRTAILLARPVPAQNQLRPVPSRHQN